MKKAVLSIFLASFLLSGCFITNLFRKKDKYGCPSDGRNVGAEKILAGEKVKKAKYRGGKKSAGE
ncbi:hypothetical protein [Ferruginibacter sp.]|jgi:hypothetical protein|nr:hypothetical protein [Ferruginibacter sp.]